MIRARSLLLVTVVAALLTSVALAYGPRAQRSPAGTQASEARGPVAAVVGGTHADLAALLGISEDALAAQRLGGKTVADILVEHGLTTSEASATLSAQRDARIDAAVAAGTLDSIRAAQMKGRTEAAIAALLTREAGPQAGSRFGPGAGTGVQMGPRVQRGGPQAAQQGWRGGPGTGVHQPGYRFRSPGN